MSERNILITGGAGFIGSHVVRRFVTKYPQYRIINLDALTYAGNLENLRDIEDAPNYTFVKADICDAEAVARCEAAGVGATVELTLGGKLDTLHGSPLAVRATVQCLLPTQAERSAQAVIQVDGVTVVVTSRRQGFTALADFEHAGVDPRNFKLVVIKLGYLFPELLAIASKAWMALSPGACDLDLARLPYQRIARPMFPVDNEFDWQS